MIFLVPLYASSAHWYPFTTPKTLLIVIGTCSAAILFIAGMIYRDLSIKVTYLHIVVGVFLGSMVLAAAVGVNPHQSFFGTFYSSTSVVLLLALGVLAWLLGEHGRRDANVIRQAAQAIFWSGVITAFVTYLNHSVSSWQLLALSGGGAFVGNSSFTGGFMLFAIAFGVYCMSTTHTWKQKLWYVLGLGMIILCPLFIDSTLWEGNEILAAVRNPLLFMGQAQAAILGLVVAAIAFGALVLLIARKKYLHVVGALIASLLVVGIVVGHLGLFNPDSIIHEKFVAAKTGTRLIFWNIAIDAIREQPILGWGFENYQTVYQSRFDPEIYTKGNAYEQWVTNPHNILFDMGVSGGLLGLGAYLTLFGMVGFVYIRAAKNGSKALLVVPAILIGYLVQNFFVYDTPTTWLMYFSTIGIAFGIAAPQGKEFTVRASWHKAAAWLVIALLGIAIVVFGILPSRESREWVRAISMPISSERVDLQSRVQHISPMGSVDDAIVYVQKTMGALVDLRTGLTDEQKQPYLKQVDSLLLLMAQDAKRYPDNFYAPYLAGSLAHLGYSVDPARGIGALDSARVYFDAARMISPGNPKVYYNLAQNALFRKDTATALALVRQGMALGAIGEGEALLERIKKL
jgi:O-antigen ligase